MMANNKCKECGCVCSKCIVTDHDVHLHVEIENLKQRLVEKENHILSMETNFLDEANKYPNGEVVAVREELLTWQDKYKRLYEAHRRVQRVNQGLEDKLLKLVDVCETEKSTLTKDVATLSHKLADANYTIKKLTEDNERYKNDVALAIQFLQCKPGNFVSQKVDSLPNEVQAKVSSYMASKRKPEEKKTTPEIKSIKVPIATFPPTAMVYSIPKSPNSGKKLERDPESVPADIVSAAIMAKVLEERERERANVKHCDTCTCSKSIKIVHHTTHHSVGTQTGEFKNSLCLKCNTNLEQSPSGIKVIKNAENFKNKSLPIYIHDYAIELNNLSQNIAKVQPNNFLTDSRNIVGSVTDASNSSSLKSGSNNSINNDKSNFNILNPRETNHTLLFSAVSPSKELVNTINNVLLDPVGAVDIKADTNSLSSKTSKDESYQDIRYFNVSETSKPVVSENSKILTYTECFKSLPKSNQNVDNKVHHRLCNQTSHTFELDPDPVKAGPDNSSAKEFPQNFDLLKGPRYCSMRLQSGSKNILLDNTHNNVAPILYTRHQEKKGRHDTSESSEDYKTSTVSDNSFHNKRVAEWIENNMDVSTSDNSRSDSLKSIRRTVGTSCDIDKEKYVEMENNVKRFLFGESEFLKTVEIGKLKYQSYRESEATNKSGACNSHTETEI